jgi:vacuolar-type H+-ATPase subunit I/STV1
MRRLKTENLKLLQLLNETEEKFRAKIDQTRKESTTVMRLISLILPYVRRVARVNPHDQEAKDIIRQIENLQSPLIPEDISASKKQIDRLQEELNDLKDMHTREIMCLQQEMASQRDKYELVLLRTRGEL